MAQSYADLLMSAGMSAGLARVVAAPYEVAPVNALPGTNIDRLPTIPIWGTVSPEANIGMNIYLDVDSQWRYIADGPGAVFRLIKEPAGFEIQVVPAGTAGELVSGWDVVFSAPIPPAGGAAAEAAAAAFAHVAPEAAPADEPLEEPPHGRRRHVAADPPEEEEEPPHHSRRTRR